jgi:DNA polymerase III subunit epsilon
MHIEINNDGVTFIEHEKTRTRNKGKSIIAFPTDYVVIDIETTGLSPQWDEIIELSAARIRNNQIVETFSELVRPDLQIDTFIEQLTGITNQMLATARSIDAVLPDYLNFIGAELLIGHNVNFDVNFIYDKWMNLQETPFKNDYIDTLRLARKHIRELSSHRLANILVHYGIPQAEAHRGMADVISTHSIYLKICEEVADQDAFIKSFIHNTQGVRARDISAAESNFNDNHPLYGKVCVFTGALEKMLRREAMQLVADIGGINGDTVTRQTNFLILGNNDYCVSIKDGKSSKHKKAELLILDGQDLQIIPENVFYDMLLI